MSPAKSPRRIISSFVILVCALPLLHDVRAQEEVDEIVVTADFRERTTAELPASVSVLDREAISRTAVQHFEELVFAIPNFNWSGDGHRARYFQIRGVGELEQYEGAPNPSVGFLVDDIDFSGIGTIATLFDIQQIEVLRGPQGSRYGANALAGLVYVQSADPTDEFSGLVRAEAGQDDLVTGGIAFGGPLTERLKYRLSAQHHESNGFRNNPFLGREDTNGRSETTLRGKLVFEPSDEWFLRFTAMYADIDDGYDAFAIDNSLTMLSDKPGKDAQKSLGMSLRADWSGAVRFVLTSITTAADSDITFSFDADWGNPDSWLPFTYDFIVDNDRDRRSFSQELRLTSTDAGRLFGDSADWLVGVYGMRLEDDLDAITQGILIDPDPVFGFTFTVADQFSGAYEAVNAAIFGQLDFDIGEASRFGIGVRIERRSTDYSNSSGLNFDPSETMVGGELTFTQELSELTTTYVSLARGFKAGGFNPGFGIPADRREFDTEYLWNLEAGIKSRWLADSLFVNASVFYADRRDQQIRTSFQLVPNDPASFVFFTDNANKGRTTGLEADIRWVPDDAWELYATVGLLSAEITEFGTPEVDLDGRDQAHAPAYTLALGGIYRHLSGFFARLDFYARDEYFFDYSHDQKSTAYEILNVRAGYDADRWSADIWLRNALDEEYPVRGFYFGNEPPAFPNTLYTRQGDPRQLGVTFEWRF